MLTTVIEDREPAIALVGAGAWAQHAHLPALRERGGIRFAAVYDLDPVRAADCAAAIGFARVADSPEAAAAGSDAVIVGSPAALHAEHARIALQAGAHVLLEKPMTTSAEAAYDLADLAARSARHLVLALGWNWTPLFHRARRLLADGVVGRVEHVSLHMASSVRDLLAGEAIYATTPDTPVARFATWIDPALAGGGYGNAQLSHGLGVLFGLVPQDVATVTASARPGPVPGIELSLAASGVLESGATMAVSGVATRRSRGRQDLVVEVYGDGGQLHVDFGRDRLTLVGEQPDLDLDETVPGWGEYPDRAPAVAFADLITGGATDNPAGPLVGARSTVVLDSLRVREPV